jgi:Flp pilus assembly protein TadD
MDRDAGGADAYAEFRDGSRLLDSGNPHAATLPLERARDLEPGKASIREALARAYFGSARYDRAATEFAAAIELDPVNDYAHFGLGRALARTGDMAGARRHLRLATAMAPHNDDYRAALAELDAAS